jgi:hypothetical protein
MIVSGTKFRSCCGPAPVLAKRRPLTADAATIVAHEIYDLHTPIFVRLRSSWPYSAR